MAATAPDVLVLPVADGPEVEAVLLLANPLVLPVALSEVSDVDAVEDVAAPLAVDDWSLLATADWSLPAADPVEAVALEVEPLAVPVEAKPLVEPVWLSELLELVDGEAAVLLLLEDWSFAAMALLDSVELALVAAPVLGVELDVLAPLASALAKPLVEPVWLSELVELVDGDAAAVLLVLVD